MKRYFQIITMVLLALGVFACSPVTPAAQEATALPQPASAEAFHPLTARTGIEEIDNILDAVASGNAQELRSLVQFTNAKCTRADGLGGPPKCREGEEEGTPVEVLPSLGPEGSFLHKDEIQNWQGVDASGLYAIYEVSSNAYSDENYPAGEYAIIFIAKGNGPAITLQVSDGRIVRVDYLFGESQETLPATLQRDAATWILPPLDQ